MLRYLLIYQGMCVGCYVQLTFKGYVLALVVCPCVGVKLVCHKVMLVASDTVFAKLNLPHLGKRMNTGVALEWLTLQSLKARLLAYWVR